MEKNIDEALEEIRKKLDERKRISDETGGIVNEGMRTSEDLTPSTSSKTTTNTFFNRSHPKKKLATTPKKKKSEKKKPQKRIRRLPTQELAPRTDIPPNPFVDWVKSQNPGGKLDWDYKKDRSNNELNQTAAPTGISCDDGDPSKTSGADNGP